MAGTDDLEVVFTDDPTAFLRDGALYLARRTVTATVLTTVAERWRRHGRPHGAPHAWFALVLDEHAAVIGAAMRTAPFAPYPLYVLDQPEAAARALARAVLVRGEEVGGVNGARPAVDVLADEVARLTGAGVRVEEHLRLFELGVLREPPRPAGGLRAARLDELGRVVEWWRRFHHDADVQAGRAPGHSPEGDADPTPEVRDRIAAGVIHLWAVDDEPVHLCAINPPALGVARIGPVFTPAEHRGRGYAAAAVAQVAGTARAAGQRVVLFTDQANPTSNALYARLGFEPVADTAYLSLTASPGWPSEGAASA